VRPRYNPTQPGLVGTITLSELDEVERDAVRSVLTIGPFAWPMEEDPDTWLVSRRLLRYVTEAAANHDRFERFYRADGTMSPTQAVRRSAIELPSEPLTSANFWTRAAAEAKRLDESEEEPGVQPEDMFNVT